MTVGGQVFPARAGMSRQSKWASHTCGVFPARAGMSPQLQKPIVALIRFPRPRGDEPDHATNFRDDLEFSPPARG